MKVDLSELNATELDELIIQAAKLRASMQPEISKEPPKEAEAIVDPMWFTSSIPNSNGHAGFSVRHPGLGWLGFAIPPHELANLIKFWAETLATAAKGESSNKSKTIVTNPTPNSGGGTLH